MVRAMPSRSAGLFVVATALLAGPVRAQADSLSAEVAIASDYIFRGFSRTGGELAVQAGFNYQLRSGFVAGAWASQVRFDYDDDLAKNLRRFEFQAFAGYAWTLGRGWSGSALLVRYQYPDADAAVARSYTEANFQVYYRELISLTVAYTPGFLRADDSGLFVELSGRYPLAGGFELSTGIGRGELDLDDESGYTYGHIAIGRTLARPAGRLSIDLGYYHSDAPAFPRWGEAVDGDWSLVFSARLP